MMRSTSLSVAAILAALLGIVNVVMTLPILAAGRQGLPPQPGQEALGGPPFFIGVFFLIVAVSGFFGAYGVWINQKWGKVVTIVVQVISILFGLGDVLGAPNMTAKLFMVGFLLASALVIFLLLRPEPRPGLAQ